MDAVLDFPATPMMNPPITGPVEPGSLIPIPGFAFVCACRPCEKNGGAGGGPGPPVPCGGAGDGWPFCPGGVAVCGATGEPSGKTPPPLAVPGGEKGSVGNCAPELAPDSSGVAPVPAPIVIPIWRSLSMNAISCSEVYRTLPMSCPVGVT